MFDPSQFINATVNSPMSTAVVVCPEGEWTAVVSDDGDLSDWFSEVEWKDKKTGEQRSAPKVSIPFKITDQRAFTIGKRDSFYVTLDSFIDLDSSGNMSTEEGKNVKIGQLRAALGQNTPGWNFSMLRGAGPVVVKVYQESYDKNDPTRKAARVARVMKLT